jgi:hypothetical protein
MDSTHEAFADVAKKVVVVVVVQDIGGYSEFGLVASPVTLR